jgi:hypothetical protein
MKKTSTPAQTFPPYLTEEEQRKNEDYEWALHDLQVRRKYAGKIVVVYHKTVLGAGKTYAAAWAAAQRRRNCPAKHEVAMPVVPSLLPPGAAVL